MLDLCAVVTVRYPRQCVGGALLVAGLSVWGGSYVSVNTKVTQTFYDSHPTTQANYLVDDHLGGVLAYEFDLVGEPGTFDDPRALEALRLAGERAEASEGIRTSVSVATVLQGTSVLVGGPDAIPDNASMVQRLYKVNADSGVLGALVTADRDRARLLVRSVDSGAIDFLALGDRLDGLVRQELEPLGIEVHQTGSSFVAYRGMSRVTSDLRDSLIAAFGVIGLVIAVLFRDVALGFLSLLPNMLPLMIGYGFMGVVGWRLEAAPAVVFTIAVGVSVDSAIHVIARFREEREQGRSTDEAVRESIFHSGRAVMITAIILSIGFAANIHSSSPATASFGRIGTLIILAALLSNLLVLPAMLKLGMGDSVRRRA
jgi:predicted RND superfamily exporter protein